MRRSIVRRRWHAHAHGCTTPRRLQGSARRAPAAAHAVAAVGRSCAAVTSARCERDSFDAACSAPSSTEAFVRGRFRRCGWSVPSIIFSAVSAAISRSVKNFTTLARSCCACCRMRDLMVWPHGGLKVLRSGTQLMDAERCACALETRSQRTASKDAAL